MSKQETVEVTIQVPVDVVKAMIEFQLKRYGDVPLQKWLEKEVPSLVVADIEAICTDEKIDFMPVLRKYGLEEYRDC